MSFDVVDVPKACMRYSKADSQASAPGTEIFLEGQRAWMKRN